MIIDKDMAKALKKERENLLLSFVAYVKGLETVKNGFESVSVYKTGIFIESLFIMKDFIPYDKIISLNLFDDIMESYTIETYTQENSDNKITFKFKNPKEAIKKYISLREIFSTPLTEDEIKSLELKLKLNSDKESQAKEVMRQAEHAEWKKEFERQQNERPETRKEKIKRLQDEDKVYCPNCLSTQITAQKKGFSVGQAITFGMLAGMVGSNKIEITCLNCGNKFKPGKK